MKRTHSDVMSNHEFESNENNSKKTKEIAVNEMIIFLMKY
jgi:hypothetical protein